MVKSNSNVTVYSRTNHNFIKPQTDNSFNFAIICNDPKVSLLTRVVQISQFIVNNSSITHRLLTPIRLIAIQLNPVTVPISFMILRCVTATPGTEKCSENAPQ